MPNAVLTAPSLLATRRGPLPRASYIPMFAPEEPIDQLFRAYLPRLAAAVLVGIDAAPQLAEAMRVPLLVDAGSTLDVRPLDLLDRQERHADVALTLGLPVAPGLPQEAAAACLEQSVANAQWAAHNRRRRDLPLLAALPIAEGVEAAAPAAAIDGVALIGAAAWVADRPRLLAAVAAARAAIGEKPLIVVGLDEPTLLPALLEAGADMVAGRAHASLAAAGRLWEHPTVDLVAGPSERVPLAICNLAAACRRSLPLSLTTTVQTAYSLPQMRNNDERTCRAAE